MADPALDELSATTLYEIYPSVVQDSFFNDVPFLAYMRDHFWNYGSAQGKFDVTKFGTAAWNKLGPQMSFKETPIFGLIGSYGFSGPWNIPVGANQVDTFESFSLNYSITKIMGKHTIKVLAGAAIGATTDPLFGLKENVIIGKLIPAGTGFVHGRFYTCSSCLCLVL